MHYLTIILIAIAVILLAKFIFHVTGKDLITLIINAVVGFIIIWLINITGLIAIPLNIITALVVGIFGVPGALLLILLVLLNVIH